MAEVSTIFTVRVFQRAHGTPVAVVQYSRTQHKVASAAIAFPDRDKAASGQEACRHVVRDDCGKLRISISGEAHPEMAHPNFSYCKCSVEPLAGVGAGCVNGRLHSSNYL